MVLDKGMNEGCKTRLRTTCLPSVDGLLLPPFRFLVPNDPHPSSASIRTSFQLNSGNFGGGLGFLARDGSFKQAAIFSRQLQM